MSRKLKNKITSRFALSLFASALFISSQPSTADEKNLVVLELFTSQGCSSCPPADALLSDLANRPNVIALSLHVDYWDYIGWKDTFAKPQYTKRQRAYANTQNKYQIYTPQLMINGVQDAVGSDRRDVEGKIKLAKKSAANDISLLAEKKDSSYQLKLLSEKPPSGEHTLWLAGYQKKTSVKIGRGENRGREVSYTNVVRKLKSLGTWRGGNKSFDLKASDLADKNVDGAAVFLQQGKTGRIIAARKLSF